MILPQKILSDIQPFRENLAKFLRGELTDTFFRGIRVPWGFYSQRGGKALMARMRIPGGIMTPQQLRQVGLVANKFAHENLHITTRQDIQLHGVSYENTIKIIEALKDFNLSTRGGGGNTIRNITACPLSGICPNENAEVYILAWGLSEYLLAIDAAYNLPRKLKIAMSGCGKDCACTGVNDIGVIALTGGFKVLCGGGMGAKPAVGKVLHDNLNQSEVGYSIKAVLNVFNKYGDRKNRHHNRLRFLIQDMGWDTFAGLYEQELNSVQEKEYVMLGTKDLLPQLPEIDNSSRAPEDAHAGDKSFSTLWVGRQKQDGYCYITVHIPSGEIDAESLIAIADLENLFPAVIFRTTQRQNLIISNIPFNRVTLAHERLKAVVPSFLSPETLLDIACCKGATTCNLGICNTLGLTAHLRRELSKTLLNMDKLHDMQININGCPNACGQHPIGMLSFSGMVKKVYNRSAPFYRVYMGGRIDAEKTSLAEHVGVIPARVMPDLILEFISDLQKNESPALDTYLAHDGKLLIGELLAKYAYVPPYEENKNYYIDFDKIEEFSLAGLGQGECGAGVIDMIESDIASAHQLLLNAREKAFSLNEIKDVVLYAARALLVAKGIDPTYEQKTLKAFIEQFVHTGVCDPRFKNLTAIYEDITSHTILKETAYEYAQQLYAEVKTMYSLMDSSFNFPVRFKDEPAQQQAVLPKSKTPVYDLRGSPCPINYVKTKLKLEELPIGDILEVLLDEGAPIQNVPRSLQNDGQEIVEINKEQDFYRVIIKRKV